MKNLIYVFADQWQKAAVGFETSAVKTPTIDQFAAEGQVFDQAISSYPLCSPHRASLLTGKYPYDCGMWTNCKIGLDETLMLKPQETTIGKVLKAAGYQTAYIGKWHLDASEQNFESEPVSGASKWDAYTPAGERRQGFEHWFSYGASDNHLNPHYWRDNPDKIYPGEWSVTAETKEAIRFLENRRCDQPFCLFISWNPPHPPYDLVPEKYRRLYSTITDFRPNVPTDWQTEENQALIRDYYAAISGIDEHFKMIWNYVREQGLEQDTLMVLSSDHGDMMGSQGITGKNIWYEESIRIPFILKGDQIPIGHNDHLFSSMDQMPTLLDYLDIEIPSTVQGKSRKEAVQTEQPAADDTVFLSMIPGMPDMVKRYSDLGLNHKCFGWRGIRGRDWKYVVDNGCQPGQEPVRYYYDLKNDPYEQQPQQVSREQAGDWDAQLKQYLEQIKDPFLLKS